MRAAESSTASSPSRRSPPRDTEGSSWALQRAGLRARPSGSSFLPRPAEIQNAKQFRESEITMGQFDGKAGLVTGAAGGIGRASAVAFAAEGGSVVVADLESSRSAAEETVAIIEAAGGKAIFVPADVSDNASIKNVIDQTVATYGRLDFALNNAGIVVIGGVAD